MNRINDIMKRKCAYCDNINKLTKEHIWSKCLLQRMPELNIKYLDSKKISFRSEMMISDVCENCNNNLLSPLDQYFCKLYDNYFKYYIEEKKPFDFEYDYELLLRSLLKITFNSSRTISKNDNFFSKFRNLILNGNENREDVLIKLDAITPTIINEEKLYPKSARCARVRYKKEGENFIVRLISINSYYFYIIISKEEKFIGEEIKNELFNILKIIPGTLVHPYEEVVRIEHFSNDDTFRSHISFIEQIYKSDKKFK